MSLPSSGKPHQFTLRNCMGDFPNCYIYLQVIIMCDMPPRKVIFLREKMLQGCFFCVICPLEHASAHLKRIVAAQAFDILNN